MRLSPRLKLVLDLCLPSARVADIGCDHGYLAAALIERGALHVYACDVKPGPLSRARATVAREGLDGRVTLWLSDGLRALKAQDCDTVVVAGMGGELIARILQESPWSLQKKLVLQPMSKAPFLRRFLLEQGLHIEAERLVLDRAQLNCALLCNGGKGRESEARALAERYYLFSPALEQDALFGDYLDGLILQFESIIREKTRASVCADGEGEVLSFLRQKRSAITQLKGGR